jgi:hypothetical protein
LLLGVVVLLLAHLTGHFITARQRGLNVGASTFIPFLGAWVELKDQPDGPLERDDVRSV